MNKQMTVKDLLALCIKEYEAGNGNKNIVISDDNEGNGFHGMFYGFSEVNDYFSDQIYDSHTCKADDTIILG